MQISFILDWTSFWVGAVSTLVVGFVGLIVLAGIGYSRQKRGRR